MLALLGMAAIPWTAFVDGHPFRIRYMVPLIAVEAIGAGVAAGIVPERRLRVVVRDRAARARRATSCGRSTPRRRWSSKRSGIGPNMPLRAQVTACLAQPLRGEKIMASMGSLGHYMQEASRAGFAIRDFLHEGNGDIWLAALDEPAPVRRLDADRGEGRRRRHARATARASSPRFSTGTQRVCEGAGLALYRSG